VRDRPLRAAEDIGGERVGLVVGHVVVVPRGHAALHLDAELRRGRLRLAGLALRAPARVTVLNLMTD
jgi:hypothetical protein